MNCLWSKYNLFVKGSYKFVQIVPNPGAKNHATLQIKKQISEALCQKKYEKKLFVGLA